MNKRNKLLALTSVALASFISAPALAVPILYSVDVRGDLLRTIDTTTGATNTSVTITLAGETISGATGLAVNSTTDEMFAILKLSGQTGRELVTIDQTTGVATSIGDTGERFSGITFDGSGILYALTGDGGSPSETLFTVSTTDASVTNFLALGNGDDGESLAFNPDDGLLYHGSGLGNEIFESVDLNALTVSNIGITNDNLFEEFLALAYAGGGEFFMSGTYYDGELLRIDTSGTVSEIGDMDHEAKGLAYYDFNPTTIPEPGSLALLGLGLAGLGFTRRRRNKD